MFCNWQHVDYRYELIKDYINHKQFNSSAQFLSFNNFHGMLFYVTLSFGNKSTKGTGLREKFDSFGFFLQVVIFMRFLKSLGLFDFLLSSPFFFIAFFACLRALFFFQTLKFVLQTRDFLI